MVTGQFEAGDAQAQGSSVFVVGVNQDGNSGLNP
jgi:hypothetical protein